MLGTYTCAVKMEYRFFSYGDAMLIRLICQNVSLSYLLEDQQPVTRETRMWEALFLILAIAVALVVLRLAKKAGLDIMPCG
mgnify:FL=1